MRCRECNIDLPENYTACPLCGAKTSPDAPKIEGIRYSECPKVATAKYVPSAFPFFLGLWAITLVLGLALQKAGLLTALQGAVVCSVLPLCWTLIGRPLFVKQLYKGNYIIMNLWSFAFAGYMTGKATEAAADGFSVLVPAACCVVMLALFVYTFIDRRNAKRAAPYAVLTAVFSLVALLAVALKYGLMAPLWIAVFAVSELILAVLFRTQREAVTQELRAKFTIQ